MIALYVPLKISQPMQILLHKQNQMRITKKKLDKHRVPIKSLFSQPTLLYKSFPYKLPRQFNSNRQGNYIFNDKKPPELSKSVFPKVFTYFRR